MCVCFSFLDQDNLALMYANDAGVCRADMAAQRYCSMGWVGMQKYITIFFFFFFFRQDHDLQYYYIYFSYSFLRLLFKLLNSTTKLISLIKKSQNMYVF